MSLLPSDLGGVSGSSGAEQKKCTRVAGRAFPDGKSLSRNRVILIVRPFIAIRNDHLAMPIRRLFLPSVDDCRIAILNGNFQSQTLKNRIATSQPLFEIVAFPQRLGKKNRSTLVRIAKQIEEGTMPLTVTEESNGFVTPVPLSMLKNMIQHFRQIELETQTDVALENWRH